MAFKEFIKEKLWPFLAGMSSALVMVLAFFIPSLQDQWDRHQSREIITQYETLGNDFYKEERYDMAEQAYQKAFELSDSKRLDLETKRLDAKINRINMDSKWGAPAPDDITEIDFQYLLHMQKGKEKQKEKAATLSSYGVFLTEDAEKRQLAEKCFIESIQLDATNIHAYINLGNLYDEQGKKQEALKQYLKALTIDNKSPIVHYNLGLLYADLGKLPEAKKEFEVALKTDSTDTDVKTQYKIVLKQITDNKSQ